MNSEEWAERSPHGAACVVLGTPENEGGGGEGAGFAGFASCVLACTHSLTPFSGPIGQQATGVLDNKCVLDVPFRRQDKRMKSGHWEPSPRTRQLATLGLRKGNNQPCGLVEYVLYFLYCKSRRIHHFTTALSSRRPLRLVRVSLKCSQAFFRVCARVGQSPLGSASVPRLVLACWDPTLPAGEAGPATR